jgi:mRNA-degrading endonuclease RelE of RelBE toxin-antitoxin system
MAWLASKPDSPTSRNVVLKVRFRRSAKRELFDLDDDAFLRVARAILELQENPRPRGYDRVAGQEDQLHIWAGRDHRVLYEVDDRSNRLIIVAVRKKDESTYK